MNSTQGVKTLSPSLSVTTKTSTNGYPKTIACAHCQAPVYLAKKIKGSEPRFCFNRGKCRSAFHQELNRKIRQAGLAILSPKV